MTPEDFKTAFRVSRETLGRLELYASLLRQWQKTINLVAPKTLDDVWNRHFADSAQLMPFIPSGAGHLVDLGSGGGFPGLVLSILLAEQGEEVPKVTLVESDTRKAAFLREVARHTGIAVDIVSSRIESITNSASLAPADVITSRALAPMPRLFALSFPLFQSNTVALFLKGRSIEEELEEASEDWTFACHLEPSQTDFDARIAVIRNLNRKKEG